MEKVLILTNLKERKKPKSIRVIPVDNSLLTVDDVCAYFEKVNVDEPIGGQLKIQIGEMKGEV